MSTGAPAGSRQGWSHRLRGLFAVVAVVAVLASLLGVSPAGAQVEFDGQYILQCSCPVWWSEPWAGEGTFDAKASLDEVILENGDATVLIHEVPLKGNSVDGMIEDRTAELEGTRRISDVEVTYDDATREEAYAGRQWTTRQGDQMHSLQYVQVWETNYLLSVEFIAPDDQFVDAWDSLESVLLVGQPILNHLDADQVAGLIGVGGTARTPEETPVATSSRDDRKLPDALSPSDIGITGEGTYESPHFGYEVTWTTAWEALPELSTAEPGYDEILFFNAQDAILFISGEQLARGDGVADYLDDMVAREEGIGGELLLQDADDEEGAVLLRYAKDDGTVDVLYATATLSDENGTVIVTTIVASAETFEDDLAGAQDGFTVDGQPVLDYFRPRQIQRALDQ